MINNQEKIEELMVNSIKNLNLAWKQLKEEEQTFCIEKSIEFLEDASLKLDNALRYLYISNSVK
jgi:hypothetical protein